MLHNEPHKYEFEEPIIQLKGLSCGYDDEPVLTDVNLTIKRGDFVGILGPSGSGKTTLLKSIMGLANIYKGEILIEGAPGQKNRSSIGYMPQMAEIDWDFPITVEQIVLMGTIATNKLFPWYSKPARKRAYKIMDRMSILEVRNKHISELSGGQKQRAFLARALVNNPHILLLDEPTSGIDIRTRDEIMHLLDEINHQDVTIIVATHEINAVAAHLPRVICVNRAIVADGSPKDIFTTEILSETYGSMVHVTEYEGLALVAESPHIFGRDISKDL
jgi:zinc/manganese transport system ATP-binding protein